MMPLRKLAVAALLLFLGCAQDNADNDDNSPMMVDGDHTHYHVHAAEIKHDHTHDPTESTAHTHEHLHDRKLVDDQQAPVEKPVAKQIIDER
ncbi:hypothetical protein Pr1d_12310 [Bythopirellula goksoeyrii]|uniref:Lipoprotein n=2 Tax=Bythopirellula goksoeyrii TaxID=1400387 RepID=A0A5B9Q8A4_9BACT|nr:hypothetical protein Pr1d_12310 [Bythopirellula goksoeyrii]